MKLYRHYKNKPYTYIGLAKHSETLEEMVIYETRYENNEGRIWARPKQMFFESIELNGKSIARFEKIVLDIHSTTDIRHQDVEVLAPLIEKCFGQWDEKWFYSKLNAHQKSYLAIAYVNEVAVGFKIGYEKSQNEFYSWLGAVLPEYRRLGIAEDLMVNQHEWCRKNAYSLIQTKSQNRFKAMLMLNIKNGFEIVGTDLNDLDGPKILLEKKI